MCNAANAYLLVLVPQVLHHGSPQIPKEVFVFGFAVTAAGSSIVTGLLSNLPIPAGCGIGCATFYACTIIESVIPAHCAHNAPCMIRHALSSRYTHTF